MYAEEAQKANDSKLVFDGTSAHILYYKGLPRFALRDRVPSNTYMRVRPVVNRRSEEKLQKKSSNICIE